MNQACRLASVIVDLNKAGNEEYFLWRRTFPSRRRRSALCIETSKVRQLSVNHSILLESLTKQADVMKEYLENWIQKVENHRSEYYYLNYFTTPQLLFLRRELGAVAKNKSRQIPNELFSLIGSVHPSCTHSSLLAALTEASVGGDMARSRLVTFNFVDQHQSSLQMAPKTFEEQKRENPYLTIDTLGRVLDTLASNTLQPSSRPFPLQRYREGELNLTVTPQNEVLASVLSLYMIDTNLPFPSAQEVLLCSSSTLVEDVCLFWRRAMKDPGRRRLFCLAQVDSLSYDVAKKSLEEFYRLAQSLEASEQARFRIVVVCAAENEDKSYVADALDAYRRPALSCFSPQNLQKYLQMKLLQSKQTTLASRKQAPTQSALQLDCEGSSVRVVRSHRAGVGKTLYVTMLTDALVMHSRARHRMRQQESLYVIVPLHDKQVHVDSIVKILTSYSPSPEPEKQSPRVIHIDVSSSVIRGLDEMLFNLIVLGELADKDGYVWRRSSIDMYFIEITTTGRQHGLELNARATTANPVQTLSTSLLDCLPTIKCVSPLESLAMLSGNKMSAVNRRMLDRELRDCDFQRACEYLKKFTTGASLDLFQFREGEGSVMHNLQSSLQILLNTCGVQDPSWAEIRHFVSFLSSQLRDSERNDFCQPYCSEDLPGFKAFVLKFLIRMSTDFATPSLDIERSQESGNVDSFERYQLRRRWEHSDHPYLFFNEDRHTITFVSVQITREGKLSDPRTGRILDANMMSPTLSTALYTQGFRLQENYEDWNKSRKIVELCRVMGVEGGRDSDPNYELTMDNMKKMLAIQMRFRCGIPVIIMGETGCGKTQLIRYMCSLQLGCTKTKNMLLMKVHGGITKHDIEEKVKEAESLAQSNYSKVHSKHKIQTVLFFDEANTTDAIGLIKEIVCDKRLMGRKVRGLGTSLQVIAACNPYRKHTLEMIQHLEDAGLGYHVNADDTDDKMGTIPLRRLVYRVHPLPDSMKALVWDFGQLDPNVEKVYIKQIVSKYVANHQLLPNSPAFVKVFIDVLAACQSYMRSKKNECSFVSLRDIERTMTVTIWFYNLRDLLDPLVLAKHKERLPRGHRLASVDSLTRSVILGLAVCYHARLKDRQPFRDFIAQYFKPPCSLPDGPKQFLAEITFCQEAFLDGIKLDQQIAKNTALCENVFMMLVCINLRIPLFLVGKPGSSKSLAKDIVKEAMSGQSSDSDLLKALKRVNMVSYQCSPLSTSEGIIGVFSQCQQFQKDNGTEHYVACVVLDEVGLAEDSPRLPLKALHPLLDDGTAETDIVDEEQERSNRVAFVGLSNWALDPAKMNRGILVNREEPDIAELIATAKGICNSNSKALGVMMCYLEGIANAYKEIYEKQKQTRREFFGLRDFYSLIKMLFSFCKLSNRAPSHLEAKHAIRRNFGGHDRLDVIEIFDRCCNFQFATRHISSLPFPIDNTTMGLIQSALERGREEMLGESRYVMLLTENYAALNIIRQSVGLRDDAVVIFGSGFPKDQEYTHICRTINRIKICMAAGRTVVLLNLDKLYESLYDTLNQYYVRHGDLKFVDLGLGNHRLKCLVHPDFRLILVVEREFVYNTLPIPLINRMEKHFLAMKSVLFPWQENIVARLHTWIRKYLQVDTNWHSSDSEENRCLEFKEEDSFIGYHTDAVATIILQTTKELCQRRGVDVNTFKSEQWQERVFDESCKKFIKNATPDSIVRLWHSALSHEAEDICDVYFYEQQHASLAEYIALETVVDQGSNVCKGRLIQVTTHAHLLSSEYLTNMNGTNNTESVLLQQFDTEQQFCDRIRCFYNSTGRRPRLLVVQSESGEGNNDMIAAARYLIEEIRDQCFETRNSDSGSRHVVLIVQVSRMTSSNFVGFQGGSWTETHLDELRPSSHGNALPVCKLLHRTISSLLSAANDLPTGDDGDTRPTANAVKSARSEDVTVDGNALIRACVHAAVSRIDNEQQAIGDAYRIIDILLRLVPTTDSSNLLESKRFSTELVRQIKHFLEERNSRMEGGAAHHFPLWIRREAMSFTNIQAGGTFKRTLWLRIVNTVTPILAELIAIIDCNSNLDLLQRCFTNAGDWITELWLDIFCGSYFDQLNLHYDDLLSNPYNETRHRVTAQATGFRGHPFKAKFPFSHLVKRQVDEMLHDARNHAESRHERLDVVLQRLVDASEIGKVIYKSLANSRANNFELMYLYLDDFVHMIYKATSPKEYPVRHFAVFVLNPVQLRSLIFDSMLAG